MYVITILYQQSLNLFKSAGRTSFKLTNNMNQNGRLILWAWKDEDCEEMFRRYYQYNGRINEDGNGEVDIGCNETIQITSKISIWWGGHFTNFEPWSHFEIISGTSHLTPFQACIRVFRIWCNSYDLIVILMLMPVQLDVARCTTERLIQYSISTPWVSSN